MLAEFPVLTIIYSEVLADCHATSASPGCSECVLEKLDVCHGKPEQEKVLDRNGSLFR